MTDALCPEEDDDPPLARALGAVTLDLAHTLRGGAGRTETAEARLRAVLGGPLPPAVCVTEPEGFAFYALLPDAYAEAARRVVRDHRPARALCLGLRSIGTTLAAVVAAELEAAGVPVDVMTVRPRGHPFDRTLALGPRARRALEGAAGGHVLVVDEGPGLSGSSFASAAEAATNAGCPDARVVLLPSWDADGASLRSERARAAWARHPRVTVAFEDVMVATGRLAAPWGGGALRDLGGGLWRDLLSGPRPPVQPQHERRKYLMERPGAAPLLLLKFAGLGARGRRALARAEAQAEAGLAPVPEDLADGFLALRWAGRPVDAAPVDRMADHLAHVARAEPAGPVRADDLLAMTQANAAEGLGEAGTGWMEAMRASVEARPALPVDGRMMLQEWVQAGDTVLKVDGLDHHDDHFWPGTQDVAWDLAGAMVEWDMGPGAREALLAAFEARTGDRGARAVLPFHEAAYLAWRLGYATLAAETLGGEDGVGMARARDRYAAALSRALERGA